MAELDDECEQFLARSAEQVDFEVDDAVKKLTRDGLLQLHGPLAPKTRVSAISLRRAVTKLDDIWRYLFVDKDIDCPICPLLTKDSGAKLAWRRSGKLAGMLAGLQGKVMDSMPQTADAEAREQGSGGGGGGAAGKEVDRQ